MALSDRIRTLLAKIPGRRKPPRPNGTVGGR